MMAKASRSLQLSGNGKQQVAHALTGKAWRDADLAEAIAVTEQTAEKFRLGRTVDRKNFVQFCEALGLRWEEVAEGAKLVDQLSMTAAENLQQNSNEAQGESVQGAGQTISIYQLSESQNIRADANYSPQQWHLVHPYGMPPHFTGRIAEKGMLSDWLNQDEAHPLLVLRALGGFGKSALTWHWLLHDVELQKQNWPRVVWWSFYEAQAGFDNFLRRTLNYLSGEELEGRVSPAHVDKLLDYLQQPAILLILDGFERELRAYCSMAAAYQGDDHISLFAQEKVGGEDNDCINLLADTFLRKLCSLPNLKGKVLMSTRLRPRPVELNGGALLMGCREEELKQMQAVDAVEFFRAQGIRGHRGEIEQACRAYGFHPLSLRLLAGLVVKDLRNPGDIQVAQWKDVTGSLVQRQNHVLAQSYESLSIDGRRLLSRMACFRSPMAFDVLESLMEAGADLESDLQDLIERGLVQRERSRFDLHPIVRRYAYDRMGTEERISTHGQLRDYLAAVPVVERLTTIDDLSPVIELYHHMVRAGQYDEAWELFRDRLNQPLFRQFGAYQLRIELLQALFLNGEASTPNLQDEGDHAWILSSLATSYSLSGQPLKATPLFERQITIREKQGSKKNWASGLGSLAYQQLSIGILQATEVNLNRQINLCQEAKERSLGAAGHMELGRLLAFRGEWTTAALELDKAIEVFKEEDELQFQGLVCAYRAWSILLQLRANSMDIQKLDNHTAIALAVHSLELADQYARDNYPRERDYIRTYWLLGAAHRLSPNFPESEHHLAESLHRCRAINLVDHEADILLDLARLRRGQGNLPEARRLVEEARTIATRSGYVLQGADIHLFLAELSIGDGDSDKAQELAQEALRLATCDGGDYTYKVAYDEAQALLTQLKARNNPT